MFNNLLLRLPAVTLTAIVSGSVVADDAAWPFDRHDPRNTARSSLVGKMRSAPESRARYPMGGAPDAADCMFADLDGDGSDELITVAGGPARAVSGDGIELWRTLLPRGKPNLMGAADLDGDGGLEIIGTTWNPATAHVFSGADGRILWERSFDEQVLFGTGTRIADLDGDGSAELFLLGSAPGQNSQRAGWLFSFRDGFAEPRQLWGGLEMPFNPHYRPHTVVADIDADGRLEIIVASALHARGIGLMVVALDALTGQVKRRVDFPNGDRNYGHLQAIKTGDKPQLDLLVIGMLGRAHMTFLANDADHMREVWHINETFQIPYNPVGDVDGDGRLDLVYTRRNADGEAPTSGTVAMIVRDLLTGEVRHQRAGSRLLGLQDLDGDGVSEMIVTSVPEDESSILLAFEKELPLPVSGRQLCLVADRPPRHMMNEAAAERSGYQVFAQDIDKDNWRELFATTADGLVAIDPRSQKVELQYRPDPHHLSFPVASGRVGESDDGALLLTTDTGLVVISCQGRELARADINEAMPRTAVAARLGRKNQTTVLATKPDGTLIALGGPALARGRAEAMWERRGTGGFASPSVVDIDSDGAAEVLACEGDSAKPVLLDASGRVLRRFAGLPSDGTALVSGTAFLGRFGDPPRTAFGAVSRIGPNDSIARLTIVDAQSGDVLWQRDGGPAPRQTPCVLDINSDGVDDLIWIHYFDLVAVDGRTGKTLWAVNDGVPGYHVVLAADLDGSGTPSLLLTGGYMRVYRFGLGGARLWASEPLNYNAGSAAAIADVDGDGHLEFGTAFTDRFACYSADTGRLKWTIALPGQGSDVAAVDIDGDGREEFVFGCVDGHVYAVRAPAEGLKGVVLWSVFLGAPVGPPVVADLDGDGGAEIIVATLDGTLHVLTAAE